jgi:hypothetical protein
MFSTVSRLTKEQIEPFVREMDEKKDILPHIKQLMFDNGVSSNFLFDVYFKINLSVHIECFLIFS